MRSRTWWRDLFALVRRRRADAEIEEEMSLHIDLQTERHVRAGLPYDEARRRAHIEFGGVERFRVQAEDERLGRYAAELLQDMRGGIRFLVRSPIYALASIALLGIGIGAATAMFTVAHGVLVRELPYAASERVYNLLESNDVGGARSPSYPSFRDWSDRLTAFEALAYVRGDEFRMRGDDGTQRLLAGYVSRDFFATFGTEPTLGRVLNAQDDAAVVLSDHVWRRRFAADPRVIGQSVVTADGSYTIVGVMPRGFRIPSYADVWLPVNALPADSRHVLTQRDLHVDSETWGRLREGVTEAQASADLANVIGALAREYPAEGEWTRSTITDIHTLVVGDSARQVWILSVAVVLVLLLTCVNVAGLQLARGTARTREMAVRAALGAGRGRIVRQLLTECALLSLAGGLLGAIFAHYAVSALTARLPDVLPRLAEVTLGIGAFGFALGLSLVAAVLAALLPAAAALRRGLVSSLRTGSAAAGVSARTVFLRGSLVSAQIALAVVMVTGSALLLRSLAALQSQSLGFTPDNVMVLRVFPPGGYEDAAASRDLYERLQQSVRAVPGVEDVALANHVPFAGGWMVTRLETGMPEPAAGTQVIVRTVSPEYFDVMRTRVSNGRALTSADAVSGSGLVINEAAARQFFGDENPVGRMVTVFHGAQGRPEFGEPVAGTIVGVVESERFFGFDGDPPPAVFVPWTWMVWGNITLVAHTSPGTSVDRLRAAVQHIEPDVPVAGPSRQADWLPLEEHVGSSLERRRLTAGLFTGFGTAALLLALTGAFGTTMYLVAQRRREIAIRTAIGATRTHVLRLILGYAAKLALVGVIAGVPGAIAAGALLRSELFGVSASDPGTIVIVVVSFVAAAIAAAAVPALRATHIHPAATLRAD